MVDYVLEKIITIIGNERAGMFRVSIEGRSGWLKRDRFYDMCMELTRPALFLPNAIFLYEEKMQRYSL